MYKSTLTIDRTAILSEEGSLPQVAAARLRAAIAKDPTPVLDVIGGESPKNQPIQNALNALGKMVSIENRFETSLDFTCNGYHFVVFTKRVEQKIYDQKKQINLTGIKP